MRKTGIIAAILIVLIGTGSAWADLADGLIAHWMLDETSGTTAEDSAGGNDGTLVNGPVWTTGQIGGALSFDGNNDSINVPDNDDFTSNVGTVCAWIKLSGWGENNYGRIAQHLTGLVKSGNAKGFDWNVRGSTHNIAFGLYNGSSYSTIGSAPDSVSLDKWYHVAVVWDGTNVITYIDGSQSGTPVPQTIVPANPSTNLLIGTNNAGNYNFNGKIDDVRIYDRALTADQIEQLYEPGNCSRPSVPYDPDPCDGAVGVPIDTELVWNGGGDDCSASCNLGNGGFEGGGFAPWTTVTGPGDELTPWSVTSGGSGWFHNGFPFEGSSFAQNGFDGDAGLFYDIYQEVAIPACASAAVLNWRERIQWDIWGLLPREYVVSVQPAGGGAPLAILYSRLLQPHTSGDTGYVTHSVDLLNEVAGIAGQTVRISFYEYIPETYTGPAQFDLDGISLSCGGGQAEEILLDVPAGITAIKVNEEALKKYNRLRRRMRRSKLKRATTVEESYPPQSWRRDAEHSALTTAEAQQGTVANTDSIIFYDDMESGLNGWTHYLISGSISDNWQLSGNRRSSGTNSWYSGSTVVPEGDTALESPDIDLTTATSVATLAFNHWYSFDNCGNPEFDPDGGIVEVRVLPDGQWQQISPVGGYPGTLDEICGPNPLEGLDAYTHNSGGVFVPAEFDLTGFVGNVIRIRFHVGWDCGNCDIEEGWYIDDVLVTGDSEPEEPSTYDVYFGTEDPPLELIAGDLNEPTFYPGLLDCDTMYYWQVVAKNSCGQTPGPVWSFTTISCPALVNEVIGKKLEMLERIPILLEKEQVAYKGFEELLKSGDYGDLNKGDIVKAKQKIHSAIQHEEQAADALEKSVEKLDDAMNTLGL